MRLTTICYCLPLSLSIVRADNIDEALQAAYEGDLAKVSAEVEDMMTSVSARYSETNSYRLMNTLSVMIVSRYSTWHPQVVTRGVSASSSASPKGFATKSASLSEVASTSANSSTVASSSNYTVTSSSSSAGGEAIKVGGLGLLLAVSGALFF